MAWGGSLNKNGSDHIRMLKKAENVIAFLEELKTDLTLEEQKNLSKTIDIITDYVFRISKKEN
ncbi:MAG: hypothetical protein ACFE9Z_10605 [Promethearchaeota archaeon]